MKSSIKIIETPRDAMQGLHDFIPTDDKIRYINKLLKIGFDTIDCGSFVSPKAIPQMSDTAEVLSKLDLDNTRSKLHVIVANLRGALDAVAYDEIKYLGYPFSISETFQLRNTNSSISESLDRVKDIQNLCLKHDKSLVIYISMGFGNPYGDPWNVEICQKWVDELADLGIKIMGLSDTIGVATQDSISYLFSNLIPPYPDVEFGAHLHTTPDEWEPRIAAAYNSGCKRFDSSLNGYGGCPMAKNDLTGNMATENLIHFFKGESVDLGLNMNEFNEAMIIASEILPAK